MHLGQHIKEVMKEKRMTAVEVARLINCERTNLYNIFARKDINTELLTKLGHVLDHDFYKDLSKEYFGNNKKEQA